MKKLFAPLFTTALLFTGCDQYINIFSDPDTEPQRTTESLKAKYINAGNAQNDNGYYGHDVTFGSHKLTGTWHFDWSGDDYASNYHGDHYFLSDGQMHDVNKSEGSGTYFGVNENGTAITIDFTTVQLQLIEAQENNCYKIEYVHYRGGTLNEGTMCKVSAISASTPKVALSAEDIAEDKVLNRFMGEALKFRYDFEEGLSESAELALDNVFDIKNATKVVGGRTSIPILNQTTTEPS